VSESLRSQLLKAGLGKAEPEKRVPKAKKRGRGGARRAAPGAEAAPSSQASTQPPTQAKARRKSALSQTLREQAKLIIEQRRLPRGQGDCAYHFVDGKKVRKLYVTAAQRDGLASGEMVLVRHGAGFEVVEARVAEKLMTLDPRLCLPRPGQAGEEDPAYADHPIPDDLDW